MGLVKFIHLTKNGNCSFFQGESTTNNEKSTGQHVALSAMQRLQSVFVCCSWISFTVDEIHCDGREVRAPHFTS